MSTVQLTDSLPTIVALIAAGLAAGWVDAVVGGGGAIQLPALLLIPGITPVQALATNKVASIMGVTVSATTYARRIKPDPTTAAPMAVTALIGAVGGAKLATHIPVAWLRPLIVIALLSVAIYTAARPNLGKHSQLRWTGHPHRLAAAGIGLLIGAYDGLLGPGTGTFFVIALVSVLGYSFLPATALAKIANFATNLGALVFFVPHGFVQWKLGLVMGCANIIGGYTGARMAVAKGSGFVRIVFLVVVLALVIRLGYDIICT